MESSAQNTKWFDSNPWGGSSHYEYLFRSSRHLYHTRVRCDHSPLLVLPFQVFGWDIFSARRVPLRILP
ncbi:hypothetical protein VTJ04DRAFT_7433 [Mycothermus thermophilus]|uniref:uncharacterized protein n=1 Tax=Humicola insolens TaxID=85995 RepID=UPI0037431937